MLFRALLIWLAILILASVNGAFRDFVMTPRLGDMPARAVSTVLLSCLVLLVTWLTIGWIHPGADRDLHRPAVDGEVAAAVVSGFQQTGAG